MTTAQAAILADSPIVYIRGDYGDGSSNPMGYKDYSGNNNHWGTVNSNGIVPGFVRMGPKGKSAISWPGNSVGPGSIYTYTGVTNAVLTLESWIWFASTPGANLGILAQSPNSGGSVASAFTYIDTSGIPNFFVHDGSGSTTITGSALATSTWHHVVASVGAAGMKLRVNKSTVATSGARTAAHTLTTMYLRGHGYWNGAVDTGHTGPLTLAESCMFTTQLSDARTDAHFDGDADSIVGVWG